MWKSWLGKLAGRRARSLQRKLLPLLLQLETLEERTVPTLTWSPGVALPSVRSGDAAGETDAETLRRQMRAHLGQMDRSERQAPAPRLGSTTWRSGRVRRSDPIGIDPARHACAGH
jgi:hypothetical protein